LNVLNQYFDRIVYINLGERTDRRQEMEAQLKSAGLTAQRYQAERPADKGDWPTLGALGGTISHYTVLKQAMDAGCRNVMVLEDDLDFTPALGAMTDQLYEQISTQPWDFLYLGHIIETLPPAPPGELQLVPWKDGLVTLHFYAVNGAILPRLVAFMEELMARPAGHPLGGPQYPDGAVSSFRAQNPDVKTLICWPVLGVQRSSRSDITPAWYDRFPIVGSLLSWSRKLRRKV
jgi:glycosyl transferase, family 25